MKATGIVRRIDDLGRVVIPKEVRRSMNIKEGDPLEIYTTNDGAVCFKPYSTYCEDIEFYAKGFLKGLAVNIAVYDSFGNLLCASFDDAPPRYEDGISYYGIRAKGGELYARIVPYEEISDDTYKYIDTMAEVIINYLEMKES
jgi:AbrB family looped-hinge helix DNA binding protein